MIYPASRIVFLIYSFVICILIFFSVFDAFTGIAGSIENMVLIQLLIVALTFEIGHTGLTYIIILADPVLRKNFPWKYFGLFFLVLFSGLMYFKINPVLYVTIFAIKIFTFLRVFHGTHQGLGLSVLELSQTQSVDKVSMKKFKSFIIVCMCVALINPLFNLWLEFGGVYTPPAYFYLILVAGLLVYFFKDISPHYTVKNQFGYIVLLRQAILPMKSMFNFGFVKAIHGFEFFYVFYKYTNNLQTKKSKSVLLATGIALVISLQLLFVYVNAKELGLSNNSSHPAIWAFLYSIIISHIIQDYLLFNKIKPLSYRIRQILSENNQAVKADS